MPSKLQFNIDGLDEILNGLSFDDIDPYFNSIYYRAQLDGADKKLSDDDLMGHYLLKGWRSSLDPSTKFSTQYYLTNNQDLIAANIHPLVHFVQYGINEGRLGKAPHTSKGAPAKKNITSYVGEIETVSGGTIDGWFYSPISTSFPVVLVNGKFVAKRECPIYRDDLDESFGKRVAYGFRFYESDIKKGDLIELYAVTELSKLVKLASHIASQDAIKTSFLRQLRAVKAISDRSGCVAITCWEGAHNPIGRAKVLYDIVDIKRPVVLLSYIFDEFGGELWKPLLDSGINILTIPWSNRLLYHEALISAGIKFDTVWICKPRLPGFELASLVSHDSTNVILDFDDNEEHFSQSIGSAGKVYGLPAINKWKMLESKVKSRTSASITLKNEFQTEMVRHARHQVKKTIKNKISIIEPIKIGFIGTVRPHKGVSYIHEALKIFTYQSGIKFEFHVYGDFQPSALYDEMEEKGVVVKKNIPSSTLNDEIEGLDIIITGYPSQVTQDLEVNKYQITSKIGDALSMGKPVLVPAGLSVEDLADIPGLFLFTSENFSTKLTEVINYSGPVKLPHEFTLQGAYKSFATAERKAKTYGKAKDVLALTLPRRVSLNFKKSAQPTLLLVWKQNDAGLYGRRIDQIARSFKRKYSNHRVVILEMLHKVDEENLSKVKDQYTNEASHILNRSLYKRNGCIQKIQSYLML